MRATVCVLLCTLTASGCASLPGEDSRDRLEESAVTRTGETLAHHVDQAALDAAATEVERLLAEPLDRERAVRIALLNHRDVQAQFAALEVAGGEYFDAVAVRNPVLDVEALWPASGGGPAWELGLSQSLLGLLMRPSRRQIAGDALAAAEADAMAAVLDVMREAELAWVRAQADAQRVEMLTRSVAATEAAVATMDALYSAGNVHRLAVARERQLHEDTRLRLFRAEARAQTSAEALNRALGLWDAQTEWALTGRLPELPETPARVDDLEREATDNSLALAALEHRVHAAGRRLGVADTTALLPKLEVGVTAERERGGGWERGPTLEFELPVFDQGQGRRARARGALAKLQHEWWQQAVEVRSHARVAAYHVEAAREQAWHARTVMLPLSAEVLDLTVRDWNAMHAGPLELLGARRAQIEAGLHYIASLEEYWTARAGAEDLRRGGRGAHALEFADRSTGSADAAGGH